MIYKRSLSSIVFDIVLYTFFVLFTLICLYPFWYMIAYSISDPGLATSGIRFWPKGFTLFNFQKVFTLKGISEAFFVSIARTVTGTAATVFSCSLLGYLFSKKEMPLRLLCYRIMIVTMYVSGGLIPTYLVMKSYGLINNFLVYILPSMVSAYYVILIKTYVEQLPPSLEESAMIDGAGYLTVFFRIIFPLSIPIVVTIAMFSAVSHWNSWFDNHIYMTSGNFRTLQYMLYNFLNEANRLAAILRESGSIQDAQAAAERQLTPMGVRMTVTMIATLPIFMVYPFMQRYFIKGIMIGAVKG